MVLTPCQVHAAFSDCACGMQGNKASASKATEAAAKAIAEKKDSGRYCAIKSCQHPTDAIIITAAATEHNHTWCLHVKQHVAATVAVAMLHTGCTVQVGSPLCVHVAYMIEHMQIGPLYFPLVLCWSASCS